MKPKRSHLDDRIDNMASRPGPLKGGPFFAPKRDALGNDVCASKDRYDSRDAARAVALMNGNAGALHIYECEICGSWHFTRRR